MQKLNFFKSSSFKVGFFVGISRILGLLRDHLLARYLGASGQADAFFTAFRIPNMLRDLLGEGALSSIIVARLGLVSQEKDDSRLKKLVRSLFTFWFLILIIVVFLGILCAPWLVWAIAPGFAQHPEKMSLTIELTRMIFPYIAFVCLAAILMGVLHHKRSFGLSSIGSSCSNLTIIFVIYVSLSLMTGHDLSQVECFVLAYLAGGLMQLLSMGPGLWKNRISLWPSFDFTDPEIRKILILIGPAVVGVAGVQINVWVNTIYASLMNHDGAIAQISFGFRIMQLPVGMVGVAVSTVLLPTISGMAKDDDKKSFCGALSQALVSVSFLMIPAVFGLMVLGEELIAFLYEFGEFDAKAREGTWMALLGYLPGILALGLNKNLLQAYYACGDVKFPVKVSLISVVINATINYLLVFHFNLGVFGLTFGTSMVLLLNTLWLVSGLKFRHQLTLYWKTMLLRIGAMVALSAIMALLTYGVKLWLVDQLQRMLFVPVSTLFGLLVYFSLVKIFGKLTKVSIKKIQL